MPKLVRFFLLSVLGAGLLGLILAGAYYQQDLTVYYRLQAWDQKTVDRFTRDFLQAAYSGDPATERFLDPQWVQPIKKGDRVTGLSHSGAMGPSKTPVRKIIPTEAVKSIGIRVKYKVGEYEAAVEYPDGKWAVFGIGRSQKGLQITKVPDQLTNSRPQPQPWD